MEKANFLRGGISVLHTFVDEEHHYEVGNILTQTPFAKKGDKILKINNVETKNLSPKKLVRMLSSGAPRLTIHKASINSEEHCLESDTIDSLKKENTYLHFKLVMVKDDGLEEEEDNEVNAVESEWESDMEKKSCTDKDLLVVSMSETSLKVLRARGCDYPNSCSNCSISGCSLHEVVVDAEKYKVTSVCRDSITQHHEEKQLLIRSYFHTTIKPDTIPHRNKKLCLNSSVPGYITIYYYNKTNPQFDKESGAPVVLNFTDSDNFLKCTLENEKAILTIECCEKTKLMEISKDDPQTWPLVFYMTTVKDSESRFESAANRGWFIKTEKPRVSLCMGELEKDKSQENYFYFFIHYNY